MDIDLIDDLLQTSMTITYKGISLTIDHLVIDTGAAHSLLSSDTVSQMGIKFQNGDKLVRSFGIGGDEYSFRKRVDQIQLGSLILNDVNIDFGVFHEDIDHNEAHLECEDEGGSGHDAPRGEPDDG